MQKTIKFLNVIMADNIIAYRLIILFTPNCYDFSMKQKFLSHSVYLKSSLNKFLSFMKPRCSKCIISYLIKK